MPSPSVEDYLKNIYRLQSSESKATTSLLAERLNIAPASVTDMVKKLSGQGFLRHARYKGVALTEKGKREALKIIRKHRLWEMFLAEVLHFTWDEIDQEAEKFEHIMSERMEEKIDEVLGSPTVDPHGDPIPTKKGEIKAVVSFPLSDALEGAWVRVLRVSDSNSQLLHYVSSIGIVLNKKIRVKQKMEFDHSLIVIINNKEINISPKIAGSIFVENI